MTSVDDYLNQVEENDCPGLITAAKEWVSEGWGVREDKPAPEQLAAALFMEASTQDQCAADGESDAEYPKKLRTIAHQILRFCDHGDPMILDLCNEHVELSNAHEAAGNVRASMDLRRVGNLLYAMYQGKAETIYPKPNNGEGVNDGMKDATYVVVLEGSKEPQEIRLHCKLCPVTMIVRNIEKAQISGKVIKEFVLFNDRTLTEADGVIFDRNGDG